jgi:hypothetical protein
MDESDRRLQKRLLFCNEVEVVGFGPRRSSDLSIGGMFLESMVTFPAGNLLDLRFKLNERDERPIEVKARVSYEVPSVGVGVEFVDLSAEDRDRIQSELSLLLMSEGEE